MLRLLFLILLCLAAPSFAQEESVAIASASEEPSKGEPPPAVIPLEINDSEITGRLRGLYAELDGLEQVRPGVRSGVVTLTGTTLTAEDRLRAEAVAARLAGVVSVENQIEVEHDVGKRLQPLFGRSREIANEVIAFLPLLAVAMAVFAFLWLIGFVLTRKSPLFTKIAPNPLVRTLLAQMVQLAFILLGLILAMRIMGATALLGSVLGAAGVFGLAVGFAIRDTIENYIASILLSIRRPFAPNDHVVIEGFEGRVTRLNSRATFLTSLSGNEIRIPNAIVYKAKIENFTAIPERRFEFEVGIGYENDLCAAMALAHEALSETEGVLADPEAVVLAERLGESTVALKVMGWVDQERSDFGKTRSLAIRSTKEAFEENGISMPEPIQNVRVLDNQPQSHKHPKVRVSKDDTDAIADISPDRTIEGKVEALRRESGEDLLSRAAPRE